MFSGFEFEKGDFNIPDYLFNFESTSNTLAQPKKKLGDIWEKYLINFKKNRSFK